jgi:hypothetical protein
MLLESGLCKNIVEVFIMRKWSEVKEAWYNHIPIQYRNFCDFSGIWSKWVDLLPTVCSSYWENPDYEFRIKPEEELQNQKMFFVKYPNGCMTITLVIFADNLTQCKMEFLKTFKDNKSIPERYEIFERVYQQ